MRALWNRVVAGATPGMAAQNAPYRQIGALEGTVLTQRLKRVLGARRGEAAARRFKRRDADLIELNQKYQRENGYVLKNRFCL